MQTWSYDLTALYESIITIIISISSSSSSTRLVTSAP